MELTKLQITAANLIAQQDFFEKHGEPMYCGFAWVDVPVTRTNSKEAKKLMELGFTKSWKPKTMQLWISQKTGNFGQSMDMKLAGAEAVANLMLKNGWEVTVGSRPD